MILIIDFGSQVTQLIARRIRELSVYCEIIPWDADILNTKPIREAKALVLSGGPDSTLVKKSPTISKRIFDLNIPILGICYGLQLICKLLGGKISKSEKREFGKTKIQKLKKLQNFQNSRGKGAQLPPPTGKTKQTQFSKHSNNSTK